MKIGRTALILAGIIATMGFAGGEASAKVLCVKSPRANLRIGPSTKFRITWEVNRYMPLLELETKGEWIKVKDVDGDTHWIYASLVARDISCVTVNKSKANIRKAPSGSAEKWFTVEKYTSFKQTGKKGNWVKIEYEGQIMWVFDSLVWPTE